MNARLEGTRDNWIDLVVLALVTVLIAAGAVAIYASRRPPATAEPAPPAIEEIVEAERDVELDTIWLAESRCGEMHFGKVGPAGEMGEYQVTPIFIADVYRLTGRGFDPYDTADCRRAIRLWLDHYAPIVNAHGPEELLEMYQRGPTGYEKWKRSQ